MSYPNSQPRKLHRSRNDRWIGGVCGGLAQFLNMDPTLVRVLVVVIAVVTAAFPVALIYLAMMLLVPEAPPGPPSSIGPRAQHPYDAGQFGQSQYGQNQYGQNQYGQGSYRWSPNNTRPAEDPVWGSGGAPWEQPVTGAPSAPKPSAEDLFSQAKHPTRPTESGPTQTGPTEPTETGPTGSTETGSTEPKPSGPGSGTIA